MYIQFKLDQSVKLYVVEEHFINPFANLDETTTIEHIDTTLETLNSLNIKAIINCKDSDQSLKHYGLYYLNIHINFSEQLEAARLFIHHWAKLRKSSVAIYCDSSMQKSIKVLKYYLKIRNNWSEENVQLEIENQQKNQEGGEKEQWLKSNLVQSQILAAQESENINLTISEMKPNVDWDKVYGEQGDNNQNQGVVQSNFIKSRFIQSRIIQKQ